MAKYADRARALDGTRLEILEERAAALARVTAGLEKRLRRAEALLRRVEGARPSERAGCAAEYEKARREARTWLWYLVVQREANGLRDHAEVLARYRLLESLIGRPVPARAQKAGSTS